MSSQDPVRVHQLLKKAFDDAIPSGYHFVPEKSTRRGSSYYSLRINVDYHVEFFRRNNPDPDEIFFVEYYPDKDPVRGTSETTSGWVSGQRYYYQLRDPDFIQWGVGEPSSATMQINLLNDAGVLVITHHARGGKSAKSQSFMEAIAKKVYYPPLTTPGWEDNFLQYDRESSCQQSLIWMKLQIDGYPDDDGDQNKASYNYYGWFKYIWFVDGVERKLVGLMERLDIENIHAWKKDGEWSGARIGVKDGAFEVKYYVDGQLEEYRDELYIGFAGPDRQRFYNEMLNALRVCR